MDTNVYKTVHAYKQLKLGLENIIFRYYIKFCIYQK